MLTSLLLLLWALAFPSGNVADVVTLQCNEYNMTAAVNTSDVSGSISSIRILECATENYIVVHNTISTNFSDCATTSTPTQDEINQENIMELTIEYTVVKFRSYRYKLICRFNRTTSVSTAEVVNIVDEEKNFVEVSSTQVAATMTLYETSFFSVPVTASTLEVTDHQPIYVQIKGAPGNELYNFVAEDCYATPDGNAFSADRYSFFDDKCGLDRTFKEYNTNNTKEFSFSIDAFRFIVLKGRVFFHCSVIVCKQGSDNEECSQAPSGACASGYRQRRSVDSQQRIFVKSGSIQYKKGKTCDDVVCPKNSICVNIVPATCRCNIGFVFHHENKECINHNILTIHGLHLDIEFRDSFLDTSSVEFVRLATIVEKELMRLLDLDIVKGIKLQKIAKDDSMLELQLSHTETVTPQEAFDIFNRSIIRSEVNGNRIRMKRKYDLTFEVGEQGKRRGKETPRRIVGIPFLLFFIPFVAILIIVLLKRRTSGTHERLVNVREVESFDNEDFQKNYDGEYVNP